MSHVSLFREYDIRGIVSETLFERDAYAIGRIFGSTLRAAGGARLVLGWDGRLSSPMLVEGLTRGLREEGIDVIHLGLCPTPVVYFSEIHLKADASITVTGSHNPPQHNGFKMTLQGAPFYGDAIQALGQSVMAFSHTHKPIAGRLEEVSTIDAYLDRLLEEVPQGSTIAAVWDAGHGATGDVVTRLIERLPGTHHGLYLTIDGAFPAHHPDPTVPENMVDVIESVRCRNLDLGIAFDGDGDRIGVVDHKGRLLWGDQLLMILARSVLHERPGATIIADIKASQAFEDYIIRYGGVPLLWKTGHSNIKAKMRELGCPLAGEVSGHIFFADHYGGYDDGMYAAVRLIRYLVETNQTLADLYDDLPQKISSPELRFICKEEEKFALVDRVKAAVQADGLTYSAIDGIRVQLESGWWLLRASNTQNVLVARYEADTQDSMIRIKASMQHYLSAAGTEFVL